MKKYEKFFAERQKKNSQLRATIEAYGKDIEAAQKELNAALENQDVEAYESAFERIEKNKVKAAALEKMMESNKRHEYTDEDVLSDWASIATAYNKKIDGEIQRFEALKKELFDQYLKMAKMQADVLNEREEMRTYFNDGKDNDGTINGGACIQKDNETSFASHGFERIAVLPGYNTGFMSDQLKASKINADGFHSSYTLRKSGIEF